MSSVVEALKKADRERREAIAPSVLDVGKHSVATRSSAEIDWRSIFWIALIVINVALALWLLFGTQPEIQPVETQASAPRAASAAPSTIVTLIEPPLDLPDPVEPAQAAPVLQQVDIVLPAAPGELNAPESTNYSEPEPEASASAVSRDEAKVVAAADLVQTESIDRYSGDDFKLTKLGAHIYSDTAERRMVMLSGQAFREGELLPNGWVLSQVGRETLIVSSGDQRFKVWLSDLR